MTSTILYRHPLRSDEAGMVIVPDQTKIADMKDELEDLGYMVVKIVGATVVKPLPPS